MPGLSLSQQLLETTAYAEAWSQYSEYLLSVKADSRIRMYDMQVYQTNSQLFTELMGYMSVRVNYFGDSFATAYTLFSTYYGYSEEEFKKEIYEKVFYQLKEEKEVFYAQIVIRRRSQQFQRKRNWRLVCRLTVDPEYKAKGTIK